MIIKERAAKKVITEKKTMYSDYEGYRLDKRKLEDMPLTAEQYEQAVKQAAKRRRV